jgi:translation elongation factor EF-4
LPAKPLKHYVKMLLQNVMVATFHVKENFWKNKKKAKKRMRQVGNVEIPQAAFMAVLKLD